MAGEEGGSFLTMTLGGALPFCDAGDVCFLPAGELFEDDPSREGPEGRGGVEVDWLPAVGANVGQFLGLGSRFMCEDVNGAAVAGATAVDIFAKEMRNYILERKI